MASKSKRRGRVFRASCILAALIIAGSSFAWFTSKDEVTNRLSANADYGVSIVESFAPPKNFLPGQEVNKDVYATNTGSIGAFVEESVTSKLSIVKEVTTTTKYNEEAPNPTLAGDTGDTKYSTGVIATTDGVKVGGTNIAITDCVELTKDEYYSAEAGSYLAFAPKGSSAKLGNIIVHYPDASEDLYALKTDYTKVITKEAYDALTDQTTKDTYVKVNEKMYLLKSDKKSIINETAYNALTSDAEKANYIEISYKSDFTPDAEGLYVFRRTIDTTSMTYGEEFFTYEGYYFKDGKYYKVKNIVVTPDDLIDMVADGENTDGQLTSATADLVYEVKETVTPTLTYDQANNRLVATYAGSGTARAAYDTAVGDLDKAEHDLSEARARLERAIIDNATSDANVTKYNNSAAALEAELEAVNARIAELEALIGYQAGTGTNTGAGTSTASKTGIEKQIEDETTRQSAAKTAAETALGNLYGTNSDNNKFDTTVGGANYGKPKAAAYSAALPTVENITQEQVNAAKNTYGEDSLYHKYLKAMLDLKNLKADDHYGSDMFNAYVQEIQDEFDSFDWAGDGIDTFDELVAYEDLKWSDLDDLTWSGTNANEFHLINTLTWNLKKAKEDYEKEKATAEAEIDKYKTYTANIGSASALESDGTGTITTVDGANDQSYDKKKTAGTDTGLEGEKADLMAELATNVNKKTALQDAIAAELNSAITSLTVDTGSGATAAANLKTSQNEYNTAYRAYKKALDKFNNAKTAYENGGDLKIYINLSDDVVTYGGVADKWQMLPVPDASTDPDFHFTNDTAVFYYTGILQPGETSSMLIDSVELDKDTTQDMYKAFDFDLDVALKSAQVTYDEAGNALATAVNKNGEFTGELDADVAITDPANEKDTALTWTAKT